MTQQLFIAVMSQKQIKRLRKEVKQSRKIYYQQIAKEQKQTLSVRAEDGVDVKARFGK